MAVYAYPILVTLLLWWFSTGAILYLDGLNRRTFVWSMAGATALLVIAAWGLLATRSNDTISGAYLAFGCGLVAWGWQLVSFYMGYITGPRRTPCESGLTGWRHFKEAARTNLYHELTICLAAGALAALLWGQPNQLGLWTFLMLWWMHLSAKLNIYFGMPNLGEELLPEHMRYLQSFMRRRPMNMLFPFSVSISTIIAVLLAQKALSPAASPFEVTAYAILTTLMTLAIAEHWFLVAPVNANSLWQYGVKPTVLKPDAVADVAPIEEISAGQTPRPTRADDSDYATPQRPRVGLESWSANLPKLCDAMHLQRLLESVGAGAFGDVESLKGVVETSSSWIRFEVEGEQARIATFSPQRGVEPLMIAMGRRVDRLRLQAAFDACAASS
jgi:putative photosynthetic complex assembly protein 2